MTNPEKQFLNVETLKNYCEQHFNQYLIVSEGGETGGNPHINCVVLMGQKRIDNVRRALLTAYYGPKLSEFEQNPHWVKYGAVGKNVKDKENLKNVCNYLKKEEENSYYYYKNIDMIALTEGMLTYAEHNKLLEQTSMCVRSAEQLLSEMILNYKQEQLQDTLCNFLPDWKPEPPSKACFIRHIKILAQKQYNLTPITSKIKIYYIEFMSRLGNYEQLENLINRVDEDLNHPRN